MLTFDKGILTPPGKDKTKTMVLHYIGGATDDKTLAKHVKRIAKVLGIGDLDTTYASEPTYTLQIKRLELKVKLVGIKLAVDVTADAAPAPDALTALDNAAPLAPAAAHGCRLTFQLLQKTQPPAEGTGRYKFCNVTGLQTP